jgi:Major tropism determinant N-terminal domain
MPANTIIIVRKGTASQWNSSNPVLASGEPGYDLTNNILKIGDGSSSWNNLSIANSNIPNFIANNRLTITNDTQGTSIYLEAASTSDGDNQFGPQSTRIVFTGRNAPNGSIEADEHNEILNFVGPWKLNNNTISVQGHNHNSSDITDLGSLATKNSIKISDIISDLIGGNYSDGGSADGFLAQIEANGLSDALDSLGGVSDNLVNCSSLTYQDQSGNTVTPQLSSVLPDFDLFRYRSLFSAIPWAPNQDQYLYRHYTYNGRLYQKKSSDSNSGSVFNSGLYILLGSAETINLSQVSGVGSLASLNNLGNISSSGNIGSISGLLVTTGPSGLLTTSSGINSNYISDFNSSVSGLLPVKNITAGSNISVSNTSGNYTVSVSGSLGLTTEEVDDRVASLLVAGSGINLNYNDAANTLTINTSGLQPSGNYSTVGHTHIASNITDFNSSVSGLLRVTNISAGTNISITSSSGNFTINSTVSTPDSIHPFLLGGM